MLRKIKTPLIIIVVAVLFIGAGLYANMRIKEKLQRNLINDYALQEKTISEQVATSLEDRVTNIRNSLTIISHDRDVANGTPEACSRDLKTYYEELDLGIGNLGRVGPDGNFRCSLNPALVGTPASKLGNYLEPLFNEPGHPVVVSRKLKVPNVDGYVVAIHVPVYDASGKFAGSVGGALYMNDLSKELINKVKFAQTGFAGMQDDNGDLLVTQNKENAGKNYFSDELQKKIGSVDQLNAAIRKGYAGESSITRYTYKVDKVAAITPVELTKGHRWVVIVNVPESEVVAIFNKSGFAAAFNAVTGVYIASVLLASLIFLYARMRDQKLQKTKDEFVALASHELRTPATAVKNYIGLLKEGYAGTLTDEQTEYVNEAYDANEDQLTVINELLQTARGDSGRLKVKYIDFEYSDLVKSVIKEQSPVIHTRKQVLTTDLPKSLMVSADQDLMRLVVQNLVSNASKYSPEKSKLSVSLKDGADGHAVLTVTDTGVGMSAKDQKKLFKKFMRIENPLSSTVGGTGLGLYLTRQIVRLHHGEITVESEPGKGTTFTCTIPKSKKER